MRDSLGGNHMKYVANVTKVLKLDIHKIGEVRGGQVHARADLPTPNRVEIDAASPEAPCMMYRYTDMGEFCGDTWHETLADAFAQARYEYGLSEQDFVTVPEGE
jgi:hypothetical protein